MQHAWWQNFQKLSRTLLTAEFLEQIVHYGGVKGDEFLMNADICPYIHKSTGVSRYKHIQCVKRVGENWGKSTRPGIDHLHTFTCPHKRKLAESKSFAKRKHTCCNKQYPISCLSDCSYTLNMIEDFYLTTGLRVHLFTTTATSQA